MSEQQAMTYERVSKMLDKQRIFVEFVDMSTVWQDEIPDVGMRARLLSIIVSDDCEPDSVPELHAFFDLSEFEEHNIPVAKRDWTDASGNHTLTWFESGNYPADGRVDFFFPGPLESELSVFKIIDIGCSFCAGDEALIAENGIAVFIDNNGKLDVFIGDQQDPAASRFVSRCPLCGRQFSNRSDTK